MEMSSDLLLRMLQELDQRMEFEDCLPADLVVCGGAALGLLKLHSRPTRDVDVLGGWDKTTLSIICIEAFDEKFQACIERVAKDHPELAGKGQSWFNLGHVHWHKQGCQVDLQTACRNFRSGKN